MSLENNSLYLKILGYGSAALLSMFYFRNTLKSNNKKEETEEEIHEVLFFTSSGSGCRNHINSRITCYEKGCAFGFLTRIMHYIESAKSTLDVCLYLLTCEDLCNSIIRSSRKGVVVRIITDAEMSLSTGSKINELRKRGIEVRMRDSIYIMHHKYVIIDNRILMNGSLNWTIQAICGNDDNLMITTQKQLVQQFKENYEFLWTKFTPVKSKPTSYQ